MVAVWPVPQHRGQYQVQKPGVIQLVSAGIKGMMLELISLREKS